MSNKSKGRLILHHFIQFIKNDFTLATLLFIPLVYYTDIFKLVLEFTSDPVANFIFLTIIYGLILCAIYLINIVRANTTTVFDSEVKTSLNNIIYNSKRSLYIVSPFISPGNVVTEDILSKARDGVKVICIINTSQLSNIETFNLFERLQEVGGEMYHHERLHSKIYMNDKEVLITSLNLLTTSFDNSGEAGVELNDKYNRSNVKEYIEKKLLKSDLTHKVENGSFNVTFGFCIRTRKRITLDRSKPVEYKEFKSSGGSTPGQFCHLCGSKAKTSVNNPFCEKHQGYEVK